MATRPVATFGSVARSPTYSSTDEQAKRKCKRVCATVGVELNRSPGTGVTATVFANRSINWTTSKAGRPGHGDPRLTPAGPDGLLAGSDREAAFGPPLAGYRSILKACIQSFFKKT